ncbi:hypothetical protein Droror1_Dr00007717, partial [Drosera rotundifolia]
MLTICIISLTNSISLFSSLSFARPSLLADYLHSSSTSVVLHLPLSRSSPPSSPSPSPPILLLSAAHHFSISPSPPPKPSSAYLTSPSSRLLL